jgi:predicted DCC family thiol-disulfide oxidoreductase YuxK
MASWHLVGDDRQVYSGGAAFAPLLRLLPGGEPVARAVACFPRLADKAYRAVADRRSFFGRLVPASGAARARERIQAAADRGKDG